MMSNEQISAKLWELKWRNSSLSLVYFCIIIEYWIIWLRKKEKEKHLKSITSLKWQTFKIEPLKFVEFSTFKLFQNKEPFHFRGMGKSQRYARDRLGIRPRYAQNVLNICLIYAQDMPKICLIYAHIEDSLVYTQILWNLKKDWIHLMWTQNISESRIKTKTMSCEHKISRSETQIRV